MGACPEFCLYHLMELKPGEETASLAELKPDGDPTAGSITDSSTNMPLFRWRTQQIGSGTQSAQEDTQPQDLAILHKAGETQVAAVIKPGTDSTKPLRLLPEHATLNDVASVLRSKNSGPYEITFDVMFEQEAVYRTIKESQILSNKLVEDLFGLRPEEVFWCGWFDQARAWKATIPRKRHGIWMAGGGFMENDIHGSQQYIPLANVRIPEEILEKLRHPGEGARDANL